MRQFRINQGIGLLLLLVFSTAPCGARAAAPSFVELGDLPGEPGELSAPVFISADGEVILTTGTSESGSRAFRWTAATGAVPIDSRESNALWLAPDGNAALYSARRPDGIVSLCRWSVAHGSEELIVRPVAVSEGTESTTEAWRVLRASDDAKQLIATYWQMDRFETKTLVSATLRWEHSKGVTVFPAGPTMWFQVSHWISASTDLSVVLVAGDVGFMHSQIYRIEVGPDGVPFSADDRDIRGLGLFPSNVAWISEDGREATFNAASRLSEPAFARRWEIGPDLVAGTADDVNVTLALPGEPNASCIARGASPIGGAVAGRCRPADGSVSYVGWTQTGGWGCPVAGLAEGVAISNDGSLVAGIFTKTTDSPAPTTRLPAFVCTAAGGLIPLGVETDARGLAVSRDGSTVVGLASRAGGTSLFRWRSARGIEWLPELAGSPRSATAVAISPDGASVLGTALASDGDHLARFDVTGAAIDAGVRLGGVSSEVVASVHATALAGIAPTIGDLLTESWTWSENGSTLAELGAIPQFWQSCAPQFVSDDGFHVAGTCRASSPGYIFASGLRVLPWEAAAPFVWNRSLRRIELLEASWPPGGTTSSFPPSTHCESMAFAADGLTLLERCEEKYNGQNGPVFSYLWHLDSRTRVPIVRSDGTGSFVFASVMTPDGLTVAGMAADSSSAAGVFRWSETSGWSDVERFALPFDLSDDGSVVLVQKIGGEIGIQGWPGHAGTAWFPRPRVTVGGRLSADGRVAAIFAGSTVTRATGSPPRVLTDNLFTIDPIHGLRRVDPDLLGFDPGDLTVSDLSADGRRIVGNATQGARRFGWILTLPDVGDFDLDGTDDTLDTCPAVANPDQLDRGGVGEGSPPDGIGDACQCGDVNGDGRVTAADSLAILGSRLVPPAASISFPERCDTGGSVGCTAADAVIIRRALLAPPTATITQQCVSARP